MAMRLPLGRTVANVFLSFYEMKCLEQCLKEFRVVFYRRYVDDIFVLFQSAEYILKFMHILIHVILTCLFHLNNK